MTPPSPAEIRAARELAGLTQTQAAALVHMKQRGWARWESGERGVNLAVWELFLLRTGQHPGAALRPANQGATRTDLA